MSELTPQQYADLWYLKFGNEWVLRTEISQDWKDISRKLMQNNLADYDLVYTADKAFTQEIIKLKETCR